MIRGALLLPATVREIAHHGCVLVATDGIETRLYLDGDVQISIASDRKTLDETLIRERWDLHTVELRRRIDSLRVLGLLMTKKAEAVLSATTLVGTIAARTEGDLGALVRIETWGWSFFAALLAPLAWRLIIRLSFTALKRWANVYDRARIMLQKRSVEP